jgi:hypothetical protein
LARPGNSKKPKTKLKDSLHEMNHMQLFAYLVKNGPVMHGTPGQPKGGKG